MNKKLCCIFIAVFGILAGCNILQFKHQSTEYALIHTIFQRLAYMKNVALYKYQYHKAVDDLQREKKILDNIVKQAELAGIDAGSVRQFFVLQITISKAIQNRYIADWQHTVSFEKLDEYELERKIRPALIELNGIFIQQIKSYLETKKIIGLHLFLSLVDHEKLTKQEAIELYNSLKKIKLN